MSNATPRTIEIPESFVLDAFENMCSLAGHKSKNWTANQADPTSVSSMEGFILMEGAMVYIEIGFGNDWMISTEVETSHGETRVRGFMRGKFKSLYLRIWLSKKVLIVDSVDGIKIVNKDRSAVKMLFGIRLISDEGVR